VSALLAAPAAAQGPGGGADPRIAPAVRPLPINLRADATVITYDENTGERIVIREGSNIVECQPENEASGFTRCYNKALAPRNDMAAKLRAEGKSGEEVQAAIAAAVAAGDIPEPPTGTMTYRLYNRDDRIRYLWVMRVPGATSESIGISTESQRNNALAGKGFPWLMAEGTPAAHVMMPINNTLYSNKTTEQKIAEAVLPLPADLQADATVFTYDPDSGERITLRQGSNQVECTPPDPATEQTMCYNRRGAAGRDISAKMRAEGRSGQEVQAAMAAARERGEVPAPQFGEMMYFLRHNDRQIKLLWVMVTPGATPESIGVSTESQRNNALAGEGRPWLMRPGTPGAHIMIPINNTPLSSGYTPE
jgi:hypothetical protein